MKTDVRPQGWRFITELPLRHDYETEIENSWDVSVSEGVDFEGQHFDLPQGVAVRSSVRWLEDSLLSAQLSISGTVEGECARCLTKTELAISDDLMYLYYSRGVKLGEDTGLVSDDGFMPVEVEFWGRTLDLSDQVWESLLLLLPSKLLCREDCKGLCQMCGANLNAGPCSCGKSNLDPRMSVLLDFKAD